MNILDWIGATLALLGVYLTIQQNIFCWAVSIVSLIVSSVSFFNTKLYGDSALQLIYIGQSIYGWSLWKNNQALSQSKAFRIPKQKIIPPVGICVFLTIGIFLILTKVNSSFPEADAILTGLSILATYFMLKKWIENWLLWVVIDLAYVILYVQKELFPYAIQYFIFSILAGVGYFQWRRILEK